MAIRKLVALIVGLIVYLSQQRLGMGVVAFLVIDLLSKENLVFNPKTIMQAVIVAVLFYVGHKLSLWLSLLYAAPTGDFAWTFFGGFIGGIIELEAYLMFTLLPLKLIISKNVPSSLKYMAHPAEICFFIGGIIQGSYMAGWQNLVYI